MGCVGVQSHFRRPRALERIERQTGREEGKKDERGSGVALAAPRALATTPRLHDFATAAARTLPVKLSPSRVHICEERTAGWPCMGGCGLGTSGGGRQRGQESARHVNGG